MALQVESGDGQFIKRSFCGSPADKLKLLRVAGFDLYHRPSGTFAFIFRLHDSLLIKQRFSGESCSCCGILINFPFLRVGCGSPDHIKTLFNSNFAASGNEQFNFATLRNVFNEILNFKLFFSYCKSKASTN